MIHILTKWFLAAFAVMLAAYLVPGISVTTFTVALFVAALMGIVNITLKPLILLLTLPLTILTLGLFAFVVNAFFFWLLARFVEGFAVDGFIAALLGSVIVSVVTHVGSRIISGK